MPLWLSGKVWGIAPRAIVVFTLNLCVMYVVNTQADDLTLYTQIFCGVKNSSSMKPAVN